MPFHPLFLQKLSVFKTIRFMDWTKQDGVVEWSDRITLTMFGHGGAYESQIQLCNTLKTNCWITVPYQASDDFMRQMATLFKYTLRKDVTIDLELSNEVWNTLFNSGIYAQKMGLQMGLSTDATIAGNLFYSMRVKQMIKIWQSVFQQELSRINLIVGSFLLIPVIFFSFF